MTREAKIGMLTGLGVIVLIGVLLSQYLSGNVGTNVATGHMADLPMGVAYRQQLTEPVGVPGLAREDATQEVMLQTPAKVPVAAAATHNVLLSDPNTAPSMSGSGPIVTSPVTPQPAGQIQSAPQMPMVPTVQLADARGQNAVYVPQPLTEVKPNPMVMVGTIKNDAVAPAMPDGKPYVIAKGDTLSKIARKFYKSATDADMERIVAANPKLLKDTTSMLVLGKTLTIPSATPVVAPVAKTTTPTPTPTKTAAKGVIIHLPGAATKTPATTTSTDANAAKTTPTAAKVYVIASGDTLEKIAKKISPSHVSDTVKSLRTLNNIKDDSSLKIGQKIKLPA